MMQEEMLTTIDNPYNPFTQFDQWYIYDETHGYHTCGLLARIGTTSKSLSDADNDVAIKNAILEIIEHDFAQIYKRVTKETDFSKELSAIADSYEA